MASLVSDETKSEGLVCPICFEEFDSPRLLPCLHTFCEKCLNAHIKTQTKDGSQFFCPICKILTVPPDAKLEKWAAAFPMNHIILYVIASLDKHEDADDLCQPCKVQGNENKAEVWCKDCQEQLCKSCNGFHKAMKISRLHKTVSIDEKQQNQQATIELNFIQDCSLHHGQRLELFCTDHRELCCVLCFAATHRECKDIRGISEVAKDQIKQLGFENISEDMKEIVMQLDKVATVRSTNVKKIISEKEHIQRDMEAKVDKAISKINSLRRSFKAEADRQSLEAMCYLQQNERRLQSFVKNVTNARNIFGHIEGNASPEQMFIMYEKFRSQIMSHYQQLKSEMQNQMEEVHLILKPNTFFEDFEKSLEAGFGIVDKITRTSAINTDSMTKIDDVMKSIDIRTKPKTSMCAAQVEKEDLLTSSVAFVKAVARKELRGNQYYSSGVILPNGRLLIVDRENKQLIEMDGTYSVLKKYDIDINPRDVALGHKDKELYITGNESLICRCTLDTELTVTCTFKGPPDTWGITVSVDNIIVATTQEVVILDLNGSMVKSFPLRRSFNMFCSIAVSRSRHTLYHSDRNDIVCRTMDGSEVFRYSNKELNRPRGIYLDAYDNVYIVSSDPAKIHQVSSDGKRSRILLNKLQSISKPLSVIFNSKRKEIVVTSFNEITVFEVYTLK